MTDIIEGKREHWEYKIRGDQSVPCILAFYVKGGEKVGIGHCGGLWSEAESITCSWCGKLFPEGLRKKRDFINGMNSI